MAFIGMDSFQAREILPELRRYSFTRIGSRCKRRFGLCYAVRRLSVSAGITLQRSSLRCGHNLGALAGLGSQTPKRSTGATPAVGILTHVQRCGSRGAGLRCNDPRCARRVSAATFGHVGPVEQKWWAELPLRNGTRCRIPVRLRDVHGGRHRAAAGGSATTSDRRAIFATRRGSDHFYCVWSS